MLAVVGMGGIGKTTLVKELYHQIHVDFEKSSFLENVKESDIVEVKKKIIMDLCGLKLKDPKTFLQYFEECWTKMKILVVIDDVEETQILELFGEDIDGIKRSENGNRVIMTGRNWKDFENVTPKDGKFEMDALNEKQAMELFSWKAFRQSTPPHDFASITNEVVHACQGLPLSLEVLGSWLSTKRDPQEWKEGLSRLKDAKPFGEDCMENDKLWGQLRICYIDLAYEEQEMFLDISCFFSKYNSKFETGVTIQKASHIWDIPSQYSSNSSLQNLKNKSLVKVNDKGNLVMHDQLRDMGRQIVKEASGNECGNQNRIWDKEEARLVLLNETVTSNIQAIWLPENLELPQQVLASTFHKMKKLRMLIMEGASETLIESCFKQHFSQLKWLKISSLMKQLPRTIGNISSLSILDLSYCKSIESLPTTLGDLKHLTELLFQGCENLKELPQTIGNISSLSILDLSSCKSIGSLPTTLGDFNHLTELLLQGCENLKELPQTIGNISSLSILDLSSCKSIASLPTTLGDLKHLTELLLRGCENLKELPQTIGNISSLSILDLCYCKSIASLPTTLGDLNHLTELLLKGCENLKELPQTIGNISSLSILDLCYCKSIASLPTTLGDLKHLTELLLRGCENLKELPQTIGNISSLSILDLCYCKSIASLPTTLGDLKHLTELLLRSWNPSNA
ncbi:unnamed protein product [Sphagnum jensenii]|uniref:Uncharacterized protein n=1 Tax=Sphagnum jensenii TaxID=128206 RepID=A0ABP1BNW6_9BRYO